jgi:hypothetical protein
MNANVDPLKVRNRYGFRVYPASGQVLGVCGVVIRDDQLACRGRVGDGREHLHRDVGQLRDLGQLAHLRGHDLRRPHKPVQGRVIDDARDRRGIFAEQDSLLPGHAVSQSRGEYFLRNWRQGLDEHPRVSLRLKQAVDSARTPHAEPRGAIFVFRPRAQTRRYR